MLWVPGQAVISSPGDKSHRTQSTIRNGTRLLITARSPVGRKNHPIPPHLVSNRYDTHVHFAEDALAITSHTIQEEQAGS